MKTFPACQPCFARTGQNANTLVLEEGGFVVASSPGSLHLKTR